MIILLIGIIAFIILYYLGQQSWVLSNLKNKCIADCVEFNKNAVASGMLERCTC
jgi:hypothetical protein